MYKFGNILHNYNTYFKLLILRLYMNLRFIFLNEQTTSL